MKKDIHPTYFPKAKVKCACGNTFEMGATKELIEIEVCSTCHPFYSGGARNLDKVGQVQKFQKRMEQAQKSKKKKS
ncbi:MAG: 50S ribosomal protein L31 [Patescibacteria group bacterium]|nr:50S ribosomal protein L31 [Patescibacteria group bacterium]